MSLDPEIIASMQRQVSAHWPDQAIALKYLIQESWQEEPEDGATLPNVRYVVFIDKDGDLDWIADDEKSDRKIPPNVYQGIARIADAESHMSEQLSESDRFAFKRMLGAAIVSALEDGLDDADKLTKQALAFLEHRINERSRTWTLISATCFIALGALVFYFVDYVPWDSAAFFGMLGSYVSIVGCAGKRRTDANAGLLLHCVETFARAAVGVILGCIGVALFKSALSPELCREVCESQYGIFVVAFASGMFDGFIPSMISKYVITTVKGSVDE